MTEFFKLLNGTRPANGGTGGEWYAPKGSRPGKWMPAVEPVPCRSGYHIVAANQILGWSGTDLWRVEVRGELVDHGDKWVAESARLVSRVEGWTPGNVALFGVVCAARVLHVFEDRFPGDPRPRRAIEAGLSGAAARAARDAARDAEAAARDAARAAGAARDAAWAAAGAAAWAAAWAAGDAAWAAGDAAGDAAGAAAGAARAARAAARDAARDAGDAARAARAAARAAGASAGAARAARDAAWAAGDAAWAAEREWQQQTFSLLLTAPAIEVEATYTRLARDLLDGVAR